MSAHKALAYDPWQSNPHESRVSLKAVTSLSESTVVLSPSHDTAPDGDGRTSFPTVVFAGLTIPNAVVSLEGTTHLSNADAWGSWEMPDVNLAQGTNTFAFDFTAPDNKAFTVPYIVERLAADGDGDAVLDWIAETLDVIRKERQFPPPATRLLAIQSLATHEAMHDIPVGQEPLVAAAVGHRLLSRLFPFQQPELQLRLELTLSEVEAHPERDAIVAHGVAVADAWLAKRSADGAAIPDVYTPTIAPGKWRPTLPALRPALLPRWANVTPFAMESSTQFQLAGPPPLESDMWGSEANEVWAVGEYFSATRSPEESEIARFWADQTGTATPPGHWNRIAATVAQQQQQPIRANARLFALLNVALADATIACWSEKFRHDFWRPITAITLADEDGNPDTSPNNLWTPYIVTPPFPEYPSGHSTFSGAAAKILGTWFGDSTPFVDSSDNMSLQFGLPDIQRGYTSFSQAAKEASRSRVLGGIHFTAACEDGLILGERIAEWVLKTGLPGDEPADGWMLF